jgi:isopentenyldiphosphate isomerase
MSVEELFEIFDENDQPVGLAPRSECHGNPALIHRTAHVVVFHPDGRILLQHRSADKDIQPNKWDTAVGGHLAPGESYEDGARREMAEEIGISPDLELKYLFDSQIRNEIESENVRVFGVEHPGPFEIQTEEINYVRFWTRGELFNPAEQANFTPNLIKEIALLEQANLL